MSIPAAFTDQEIADQITRGGNWWYGDNGDMVIKYSFSSNLGTSWGNTGEYALDATQQAWVQTALNSISDIFGFTFTEVSQPNNNTLSNAYDIIQFVNDTNTGTYSSSYAYSGGANAGGHVANAVVFDQTWDSNQATNLEYGSYGYMTMLHEILHSLGMEHPGEYNAGSGSGPITYQNNAEFEQDTHRYTVMSYFDSYEDGSGSVFYDLVNDKFVYPRTLMVYDILAMSSGDYDGNFGGYGFNSTTRNTDTVYGYNVTSGIDEAYDFDAHGAPVLTIYDIGGIDTLDLSGDTVSQEIIVTYDAEGVPTGYNLITRTSTLIDLREGGYSSSHGMKYNIGIAFGTEIENAIGTIFNDTIYGNDLANNLQGGEGDDTLYGGDGDDTLIGGQGADTLDGGANTSVGDTVSYAEATSAVYISIGGSAGQSGYYSAGDRLYNIENLIGSIYNDVLYGSTGSNTVSGGEGNDILYGLGGNDILNGNDGDDLLNGAGGADQLNGGDGIDTATYFNSGGSVIVNLTTGIGSGSHAENDVLTGVENLIGSSWNDILTGDSGSNEISGGIRNDTIAGLDGDDILRGDGGIDTLDYSVSPAGVNVNLNMRVVSGGHAQGDTIYSFENVIGSEFADNITGSGVANVLDGMDGNDILYGLGGNDILNGNDGDDLLNGAGGADQLNGGDGIDTATYFNSGGAVNINLANGTASGSHATGDVLNSIENLIGSAWNDILTGDSGSNEISGGIRNDTIAGLDGDDILRGDGGIDTLDYSVSPAGVNVNLNTHVVSGGHAQGDTIYSFENVIGTEFADNITGSGVANVLDGMDGNDILYGLGGNDILNGNDGDDLLNGAGGADQLNGGDGIDTATYFNSGGAVNINLANGTASGSHATGDVLNSIENLIGSAWNDTLVGDDGDNAIDGGLRQDTIEGGLGNDILIGGGGADEFVYTSALFGHDVITDFTNNVDKLIFSDSGLVFSDLLITQNGANTVITVASDPSETITLLNFDNSDLDINDFVF